MMIFLVMHRARVTQHHYHFLYVTIYTTDSAFLVGYMGVGHDLNIPQAGGGGLKTASVV